MLSLTFCLYFCFLFRWSTFKWKLFEKNSKNCQGSPDPLTSSVWGLGIRNYYKNQERSQDLLREELEKGKFLWHHFDNVFSVTNLYDVIKMTAYVTFWSFIVSQSIFKTINWPNYAISDHWDTEISKQSDILSFF